MWAMWYEHRTLTVVTAVVVAVAVGGGAVVVTGHGDALSAVAGVSTSTTTTPSDPCVASPTTAPTDAEQIPTTAVVLGTSSSDVAMMATHRRHLHDVVVPTVAAERGRLVAFGAGSDAKRQPALLVDLAFAPTGDAADNPDVARRHAAAVGTDLDRCVDRKVADLGPGAARSDPFGAVALAGQAHPRRIVVLADGISTTPACNLTTRDLRPQFRTAVLADCAPTPVDLHGVEAWLLGIGVSTDPASPDPALLTDLWRSYLTDMGAEVTVAAQTVPGGPR